MHHVSRLIFVVLLLTATAPALAQQEEVARPAGAIGPGADGLDPSVIEPFAARYAMTRGGKPWANSVIQVQESAVAGQPAWRHSFSMNFTGQTIYDETLLLRESLAPIMKFIHGGMPPELAYKVYTYQDNAVRGSNVFADGRDPAAITQSFEEPVFGAGMATLVFAALPLAEGFAGALTSGDDNGVQRNAFRVEGKERLTVGKRSFETWIVSVLDGQGKQWISHQAPYLIKQEFPGPGIAWTLDEVLHTGSW